MAKRGKKYTAMIKKHEEKLYTLDEAVKASKASSYSKFPGTVELHVAINVPKDRESKSIKGSVSLPHQVKKEDSRIIVFCENELADKAKKAGAVEAGLDDLIKKIQDGWMEFDVALAVPSVMGKIAVLGKNLGPKGLMPNPKTGTLVEDIEKAIGEFQKGKTNYACDESGVIHLSVGKVDTEDQKIKENALSAIENIATTVGKPTAILLKSVTLSPTMGAGAKVSLTEFIEKAKEEE